MERALELWNHIPKQASKAVLCSARELLNCVGMQHYDKITVMKDRYWQVMLVCYQIEILIHVHSRTVVECTQHFG